MSTVVEVREMQKLVHTALANGWKFDGPNKDTLMPPEGEEYRAYTAMWIKVPWGDRTIYVPHYIKRWVEERGGVGMGVCDYDDPCDTCDEVCPTTLADKLRELASKGRREREAVNQIERLTQTMEEVAASGNSHLVIKLPLDGLIVNKVLDHFKSQKIQATYDVPNKEAHFSW